MKKDTKNDQHSSEPQPIRDSGTGEATRPTTAAAPLRHCHCCEQDYHGNYCPNCGQQAGDKRITWHTVRRGILDVWGLGSRSLPHTLWQLIRHPGEIIAQYIDGRRQLSFPPIKMLFIISIFIYLIYTTLMWYEVPEEVVALGEDVFFLKLVVWFSRHYAWAALMVFSLFIIPTYIIFRESPRNTHHTIPEGFFIQMFNASVYMFMAGVATIIEYLIKTFLAQDTAYEVINRYVSIPLLCYMAFMLYKTYRRLFGYGRWSTIWRLIAVILSTLSFAVLMLLFDMLFNASERGGVPQAIVMVSVLLIVTLLGSRLIDRRTAHGKKRKK